MNIKKAWAIIKPVLGFTIKGAKWYVKARYGVDVDEILKTRKEGGS